VRRGVLIAAVVVLAIAAATAITVWVMPRRSLLVRPEPSPTASVPLAAGPVRAPSAGALLGAWVRPASLTQAGRLDALQSWEKLVGRRMDVVNTYRRFDQNFFESSDRTVAARGSTLMLSWASGDTRQLAAGAFDSTLVARARELKAFQTPVLLRFRWEMDRPNLRSTVWAPADYIAAWKHVRAVFTREGATNASWVWCPTAEGYNGGYAQPYYPGDDQVDWVCADIYAGSRLRPIGDLADGFLSFAAQHPSKPAMVGEFGVARAWGDQRAAWLRDAGTTFKAHPQIRAVMYFESDPTDGESTTQQFELSDDPSALAAFKALADERYFNTRFATASPK
jgi:hypothetical protein